MKRMFRIKRLPWAWVHRWVKEGRYANCSRAIQSALAEMVARDHRQRFVVELSKLDRKQERALADEALSEESPWPGYSLLLTT